MEKEGKQSQKVSIKNIIQVFFIGLAGFIMGVAATIYIVFKNY